MSLQTSTRTIAFILPSLVQPAAAAGAKRWAFVLSKKAMGIKLTKPAVLKCITVGTLKRRNKQMFILRNYQILTGGSATVTEVGKVGRDF